MTTYLKCSQCPHLTEVSEEDQDSSLTDAIYHEQRKHNAGDWRQVLLGLEEVTV